MGTKVAGIVGALLVAATLSANGAWAQAKVTVTREANKPESVEIKAGQEVRWVNGTGGTAHISFGKGAIQFFLGKGENRVKFTEPGTYEYAVHVSGVKGHAHTGTVVVK